MNNGDGARGGSKFLLYAFLYRFELLNHISPGYMYMRIFVQTRILIAIWHKLKEEVEAGTKEILSLWSRYLYNFCVNLKLLKNKNLLKKKYKISSWPWPNLIASYL